MTDYEKKIQLKYDYFVGVNAKDKDKVTLTEQDKNHIRIIAILELAKQGQIDFILNHNFTECFKYDKKEKRAYYCINMIRKEKETYADS